MKAPFNNNLPPQAGDVIYNPIIPINSDSKTISYSARNFLGRRETFFVLEVKVLCSRLLFLVLNQDLQDFEDYRGRLRFKPKGHL